MKKNKLNKTTGFTLIELLVVIAIIGLLSTLAVIALDSARQKSRDSKRVTDVKQLQTALELYFNDQDSYPATSGGASICLGADASDAPCTTDYTCLTSSRFETTCTVGAALYMGELPTNPRPNGQDYTYLPLDVQSGVCLIVAGPDACATYQIRFILEGSVNELQAGTYIATPDGLEWISS